MSSAASPKKVPIAVGETAAASTTVPSRACWLMKAEPETRLEKGKDVAFSASMFEQAGTSPWDGVRNHQAKNYMRDQMRLGDAVLFYHSACKRPGIAALAEVCKEGYPDYTAWDVDHPYYDPRSNKDKPTWYMVDVKFRQHLSHFVSLKLLQNLIANADARPDYLTSEQVQALREMPLLSRGRLSVQSVSPEAYEAICLLGEKGGFGELETSAERAKAKPSSKRKSKVPSKEEALEEAQADVKRPRRSSRRAPS